MDFVEIEQARKLLAGFIPITRLVPAKSLSRRSRAEVYLKLENELPTGSFKIRGAMVALEWRRGQGALEGVVASSTGNHGAGVAFAARRFGVPATIFLPEPPNAVKRAHIIELGASVVVAGQDYDEVRGAAARYALEHGWYFVEDGRDPNLLPGPATIGCEITEQLPDADVVFVPVGDSTLIRGLAFAVKHVQPHARIVGVQAERAPAYFRSWKEGGAVVTDSCDTVADGLAVRCASEDNVRELRALVDEMRLVSDKAMLGAVLHLLVEEHVVAEPSGAATTAALLGSEDEFDGKKVVLLVTGSNVTPQNLAAAARAAGV
ncbi:MAG: threonine/serine dehydratase [Acidobacteria bacterium]|nr:threonine/serine dehydratase [Acidobacteriota bacterium]